MIEVTERAARTVAHAESAARRFNPAVCIRLERQGAGVRFAFTDDPDPQDDTAACGHTVLYVEPGLDGTLDTGDHEVPVLTPPQ
jgi:hypothetical protein